MEKLVDEIQKAGITITRNVRADAAKNARMEYEYKNAHDFVNNTGQGLMDEGKDVTEIVFKKFNCVLDPNMENWASRQPLELIESEGKQELTLDCHPPKLLYHTHFLCYLSVHRRH